MTSAWIRANAVLGWSTSAIWAAMYTIGWHHWVAAAAAAIIVALLLTGGPADAADEGDRT